MASSSKTIRTTDNNCNQRAITCCEGCSQRFCPAHLIEYRNLLNDEMNALIREHDYIKNSLEEQRRNGKTHEILKRIYEWEKDSIAKIKKRAKELQLQLAQFAEIHNQNFKEKFQSLSEQMNQCRAYGDYIEADLYRWKQTIEELKLNFIPPITVNIEQHDDTVLVENITVNIVKKITNESFEQIFDDKAWIEQNGQLVIHDTSNNPTEIRGKNEYITGCYNIRLCVEETLSSWIFIGIISKLTPLRNQSYSSETSYGWSSNNYSWSNGEHQEGQLDNRIEMKNNDIISLFFDCDNCTIMMINERTQVKHILPIMMDDCPFPWQLHIVLREPNSRIRILST